MATIVQVDDFQQPIEIAQLSQQPVRDAVQDCIDLYEPEFLTKLLGIDLYNLFNAGLVFNEDGTLDTDDTPEIWVNLLNQIGGAIANYIYYNWNVDTNTQTSGIGQTKANSDNAAVASPIFKMVKAWNKMVETVWQVYQFINNDPTDYGVYYIANLFCYGYFNAYCNRPEIFDKINSMGI